jgi:hypothetical protein
VAATAIVVGNGFGGNFGSIDWLVAREWSPKSGRKKEFPEVDRAE